MKIVTRFAPSNTGELHIGGARTALFNWLYARHNGGEFHLRIEDTDLERSDKKFIGQIIDGLNWLGLSPDGEVVYQSQRADRHREVAEMLLASGHAYRCFMTDEENQAAKSATRRTGIVQRSPWRAFGSVEPVGDVPYTVRLRMPDTGETVISDLVQGEVTVQNNTLDDYVILRADGSPMYMLAVVVDDHDMGVTHVLRGDDHLTNAFRQLGIIRAMGWAEPVYGHFPLIHDETGKKLSKRHGAAGLDFYRNAGFLSDAVFNYLLRMGWGHGDHEIFTRDDAVKLFDLDGVGKAPARLDIKRLEYLNGTYLRDCSDERVLDALREMGKDVDQPLVVPLIPLVKGRSKTLEEAWAYIEMTINGPVGAVKIDDPLYLHDFALGMKSVSFDADSLKKFAEQIAEENGVKVKHVIAPIRMALMGSKISPPLFESMILLGSDVVSDRLMISMIW